MRTELPCLPLIEERFLNEIRRNDATKEEANNIKWFDADMTVFKQIWGSTALGFGGIGGQTMTSAYTTVVEEPQIGVYGVFFGERFAYLVTKPTERFKADFARHQMASVAEAHRFY